PRVVDDGVQVAEGLDRGVDEALRSLEVGDVVAVGDRLAPHPADLVDHLAGGTGGPATAVDLAAEIVHHELGAVAGQHQGVLTADAASGAGDDHDPSLAELAHPFLPGWPPEIGPAGSSLRITPARTPTGAGRGVEKRLDRG